MTIYTPCQPFIHYYFIFPTAQPYTKWLFAMNKATELCMDKNFQKNSQ